MAPQVFAGKYIVQEEIARGGMGIIYKALDRTLNRVVAIKLVHAHFSGDSSFAERFLREARAMARLHHKNVVTIYAVEEERGTQFLVMEFCPGKNLRELIRKQSVLPVRDVVNLAQQLASALAYAHAQGVIHRDIKPANVLVDQTGTAKLTDFGIAAALDEAALTSAGQVIGTPEYMSPEQARGGKVDGRSDLYSLGIVMYEMLTGRTPYSESSGTSILAKLAYDREELVLQFPTQIPSLVQGVVRDLLRRNPDDRISDAETLASQLHEILYTLPQASAAGTPDRSEPTKIWPPPGSQTGELTRPLVGGMDDSVTPPPPQNPPSNRFAPRTQQPGPPAEDHTILVHTQDRIPPKSNRQSSVNPPPREIVTAPAARPLGIIIAAGIALLGLIGIGLISYFGPPPAIDIAKSTQSDTGAPPKPPPDPKLLEKLKIFEENLAQLETLVLNTSDRLQTGQSIAECPSLKALLVETYAQYEHTILDVNELRQEVGRGPAVPIHPPTLDMNCGSPPDPPRPPPVQPKPPKVPTFPDEALQSLLDRFQHAYERRDLAELRSLSQMDQARQRYVEEMFRTYQTLKLSRATITQETDGAAAVLHIDTAITTTGETVELSPIAKKITLHVSRNGDNWGKIVW